MGGMKMAMTASTSPEAATSSTVRRYWAGGAEASMSTGLATAASAGSPLARLAWSPAESWTTSRPPASQASAPRSRPAGIGDDPHPPAGWDGLVSEQRGHVDSSPRLSVRITPA